MSRVIQKLLITGATGLVGKPLTQRLLAEDKKITVLSRNPDKVKLIFGDSVDCLDNLATCKTLDGFDAIINLAGEPLADKRWSIQQKTNIQESRWKITEQLSELCLASSVAQQVFISGSAIGFYASESGVALTEQSPPGQGYLHQVCAGWEQRAIRAADAGTRICLLRTSLVLAAKGGVLSKLLPLFKIGLGGRLGSGKQMMSWIHIDDMVSAILYLLAHNELSGAFNLCAPQPVSNAVFTQVLAKSVHRVALAPVPLFALRLLYGEMASVITADQEVLPERLMASGFRFNYPEISSALSAIVRAS